MSQNKDENKNMTETDDYKDTLFLPRTDYPMRAGLTDKEPKILERWWPKEKSEDNLYHTLMDHAAGRETFVLHWGPPFANGNLHLGHVFKYILNDTVIRSQFFLGKKAPSVFGWDCHGRGAVSRAGEKQG